MHGALTLATRCELTICGHICYDLWALTSSQREKEQNVAKGKFQLAHQTRRNLQAVALSTVAMCASKSDDWDAFRHPHGLSEIHIERFFGRLRAYSASGDLSARQLWNAEAVQMRRLSKKKPAGHVPTAAEETPLNAAQLLVLQQIQSSVGEYTFRAMNKTHSFLNLATHVGNACKRSDFGPACEH